MTASAWYVRVLGVVDAKVPGTQGFQGAVLLIDLRTDYWASGLPSSSLTHDRMRAVSGASTRAGVVDLESDSR
jgi:hypothetical protein